jgi:hypothetical protein
MLIQKEPIMSGGSKGNNGSGGWGGGGGSGGGGSGGGGSGGSGGSGGDPMSIAVQSLHSSSDNTNLNGNGNGNGNGNLNLNGNGNLNLDGNGNWNDNNNHDTNTNSNTDINHLSNDICNDVTNTVETHVDTCVNVTANLELDSQPSAPVIDLHGLSNIHDSLIMPDVVTQSMGDGNMFNVDQVNNLVDNDTLSDPSVSFSASGGGVDWCGDPLGGGSFNMDAHIHGGTTYAGGLGSLDHASTGVSADAAVTQSAFNQTITQGANIQFNSQTITAGHDVTVDDHHTG